ncbi:CPBP family intramembrane glutamic endopeptidase [Haloferula sp. BvORR071]|uniref:CPBP family intramembrane glutamic endopeptidase n=1 Tax=Haloferula sp. BvORR071 TaxID=1396141 RepID=UPI000551EA12|nr:CPBP family intramembrane glutamic endopeptidase [Haloferula sp. BvORR071]
MRSGQQSDVLKIFAYVAATLILGAVIAPWLYNFGKGMAEVFSGKESNAVIHWLADAARRADFTRFFNRAVLLAAVLLLFPLMAWLRLGRASGKYGDTPWSVRLPQQLVVSDFGQPLKRNFQGWLQFGTGFFLAAGLLLLSGWVMIQSGCFVWRDMPLSARGTPNKVVEAINWAAAVKKGLPAALATALIEETLFRGVLLGIFLRAMRPAYAIATLSFLFAFVHFLEPPVGVMISDPESASAGFQMLGQIFGRFADPVPMVSTFLVLSAVGVVLAYSRYRTASLWLPVGLHFGWVFGEKMFKAATWVVPGLPRGVHWFVGETLKEGLLPLSVVVITGILVHAMTREVEPVAEYRN